MSQPTLFPSADLESSSSDQPSAGDPSFTLAQLEVYNWGPFRGLHRADFDPTATAIIGPTGSGKTTLVDALMTLLVAQPRYNLASTGGHESDRTLISYVRGVLGGDGSDGREEVARPGKTITGICATYQAGQQTVRLAALLWTDGPGNAADDLKKRWVFSTAEDQNFESWLRLLHDEGIRELLRLGKATASLRFFDSKKAYLTHIRKFFDVGENAFTLLNRAAGLKQLNSIDEIFRGLVLEDRAAFDRAMEVAAEFDNLAAIHTELETAKKQQESLLPVAEEHQKLLKGRVKVQRLELLKQILPIWFAIQTEQKWEQEIQKLLSEREALEQQKKQQADREIGLRGRVDALRERYLELGGNRISQLEETIELRRESVQRIGKNAQQYRHMISQLQLSGELTESSLGANQATLKERRATEQASRDQQQDQMLNTLSKIREHQAKLDELEAALEKVLQRPGSNIPPRFQDFRSDLAQELGLADSDLPFLAEMIEVKPSETAWRGAIERAIGSERLRVLVPENKLSSALRWVNHRDNRLHVRLQQASAVPRQPTFFTDGYVNKLNFKQHPLAHAAQALLADRDLHCVASSDALQKTEHAMTVEGAISGRKGKFEKQDQRRLDQDWLTGFDNKDQLEALRSEIQTTGQSTSPLQSEAVRHRQQLADLDQRLSMIDALLELEFSEIDLPKAESELAGSQEQLTALLDPNSDTSQARELYNQENQRLEDLRQSIGELQGAIAQVEARVAVAQQAREKAHQRASQGISAEHLKQADAHFKLDPQIPPQDIDTEERRFAKAIEYQLSQQNQRMADIEQQLVRKMEIAKRADTGALADVGSAIDDVPHYLERLRVLNEEALPEKRSRFLEYLNRSSDQGVTQLLASIDEEVDTIEQRIRELNQTLVKVDYRSGRYLQLQPQRIKDERLRALDVAMRKVRSAALKDDGGESHYRALREMVAILREAGDNRRQQGSKALLDPRFRLQFYVVEVDRKTGAQSPPRTGSQSGSGGEKELMASHILTASLSYALCPPAATRPLHGTVILDEAFSKSSPSAASRIIEALKIFGLHPIFVTPNKEISLLKEHTRKVICVQRPGKEASLACISWEILEELARSR